MLFRSIVWTAVITFVADRVSFTVFTATDHIDLFGFIKLLTSNTRPRLSICDGDPLFFLFSHIQSCCRVDSWASTVCGPCGAR
jgi:hypothetical protein